MTFGANRLLEGKVVVVTAAAGAGIGAATARRCIEEGATVVISDHHMGRLERAADSLEATHGVRPLAVRCDVTIEDEVQDLFHRAIAEHDHVDVLVNNAALGATTPLVEMTDEVWTKVLDVTLTGTMRCTRAALRHFVARRSGVIVNLASVVGWKAAVGQAHYSAAKAGVMALTRCAALEAAPYGIRVNAVAPTLVWNPFLEKVSSSEVLAAAADESLLGRSAEPDELANVVVFLASDYSSYMSGEVLSVSAQHP
jgi:3-oxoacyl-[acyl-carrier protein] reductase